MGEISISKPTDRFLMDRREPSIGRTIHYVLFPGEHRPAIVTRIHDDGSINAMVVLDGLNDTRRLNEASHIIGFSLWAIDVKEDPGGYKLGSWHWPETWSIPS